MYILNITFLVAEPLISTWQEWIRQQLIPSMTSTGLFLQPQLARVHSAEQTDGVSFALQFHTASVDTIDEWLNNNGNSLQQKCTVGFGGNVLFFATTLEVLQ